jgi:geranylgeranyl pyrophosphate synthase
MEMEILPLEELSEVEEQLRESLGSEVPIVAELSDYLFRSKGKRLRPTLAILFYKLCGAHGSRETLVEMATVLELIHLATLVHDDVIDESAERRGRPALWTIFGSRMAVLQGDFIFSRVFAILNRQEARLRFLITDTVEEVLEGELLQEELRWQIPTERGYFAVIQRKTAALISAACAVGALIGGPGLPEEQLQGIREVGLRLGIAYQMADDLLDIFGDGHLGKPRWKDRDEGWITLPYLRLLAQVDGRAQEWLRRLIRTEELSAAEREELLQLFDYFNIKESFTAEAQALVNEAKRLLAEVEESELKQLLLGMMDSVVERDR